MRLENRVSIKCSGQIQIIQPYNWYYFGTKKSQHTRQKKERSKTVPTKRKFQS